MRAGRLWAWRGLLTFMLGHFTVDLYSGLLPILYALTAQRMNLDNRDIGLLALCYTAASSLSQPLFGYVADRWGGQLLAPLSLAWSSVFVSALGLVDAPVPLYAGALLAGLGSGAYHPVGASNASMLVDDRHRNTAMSVYTVSGTSGYALGPLIAALLFGALGTRGSLAMLPLGLSVAVSLRLALRQFQLGLPTLRSREWVRREPIRWGALAPVMTVVMLRSWVFMAVVTFVPVWYRDLGYDVRFYGLLASVVIASGSLGTLLGGVLADRIGQRAVLTGSLALAVPALLLFAGFPGPLALLTGALFGALVDASISVTLVAAQRLLPGRIGVASGFILGMGFVTGGVGAPVTGAIADHVGFQQALLLTSGLLLVALAACWLIPRQVLSTQSAGLGPSSPSTATPSLSQRESD
ncbi:Fosmidomycin resistance protein [bacterium HR26]|nr:Fosmidomycin resistance protein [bacterium HR26]